MKREQVREHELRAWEMRQRGWSLRRIAAEMGLTFSGVSRILSRVSRRVLAELKDSVEAYKTEQHARLDHVVAEASAAWEASKTSRVTTTREKLPGGRERVVRVEERCDGDPAFLAEMRAALRDQRSLWGLGEARPAAAGRPAVVVIEQPRNLPAPEEAAC